MPAPFVYIVKAERSDKMRRDKNGREAVPPSREEIAAFYERHADRVFRLCMSYLRNTEDAADAMQDTFLRWLEDPDKPQGSDHEKGWLALTAANLCRDRLRRMKRFPTTNLSKLLNIGENDRAFDSAELFEAVASLPEKYKTVIFLFYYEDMTTEQISEATGIKRSTVTSLLTRGRRLLRKIIDIGDDDDG